MTWLGLAPEPRAGSRKVSAGDLARLLLARDARILIPRVAASEDSGDGPFMDLLADEL
jgi:hypothetical protein